MLTRISTATLLLLHLSLCAAGQDSTFTRLRPTYDNVSRIHRMFFGENYRKEWSDSTKLPVIDLNAIDGGLKPVKLGGGHQTVSLRMIAASGKEWVLRKVEKDPSVLLPVEIRQTFARNVIDDAMSAQHPFSPLVVAELAKATGVLQAAPIIGVIRDSSSLAGFGSLFFNKVCLLEEREPFGNSDNTARMLARLREDNDNSIDAEAFIKARLLDLLIGDWDRHPDQWRWIDTRKGKSKYYVGIPRDRDQAFYVNQGLFPRIASRPWFVPSLQGFRGEIWFPKYSLKESSFMHASPAMHMPHKEWMRITNAFVSRLTDDVLENALMKMPTAAYERRHEQLLKSLKQRRDNIPAAMNSYYRFVNRIAEITLSDKHERVVISDSSDVLIVQVFKVAKQNGGQSLLHATFLPSVTKELRIFLGKGNDSVVVNVQSSPIRMLLVGGVGEKKYNVISTVKKINLFENDHPQIEGNSKQLRAVVKADSLHTTFTPANRYQIMQPLVTGGFNRDDGFLLGLGLQYTHQGFRKVPYAGRNRIMLHYSFATSAFRVRYGGEFIRAIGNADVITAIDIYAPDNTHNFFGRGNETVFDKASRTITFYRTRFNLYNATAGLRWRLKNGWSVMAAPVIQHYRFDSTDNKGRILTVKGLINSTDSISAGDSKWHAGAMFNVTLNRRNNQLLPTSGYMFNLRLQGLGGLNAQSRSFGQILPEFSAYIPLNGNKSIVLAERLGGGVSLGKPAFYQSLFTGGHGNLLGYRQFRFAGEHMVFNNLELRMKLANFTGYIIPGEFGLVGFYDAGRVWIKDEHSKKIHHGKGGGLYFAPAKMAVISIVAGHSEEGLYPYITFGFRY